ncbi:hypothetical protein OY671_009940 [Metschnikowia pulcherrima]|nr:hypothetical protein OY671_009940 [Metschnikowia pulcherrima]
MLMPLKRYADFSGRSRRKEYWMYISGSIIAAIVSAIIEGITHSSGLVGPYGPLTSLLLLGTFIPSLAVAVRRSHDVDKSGWWYSIAFIPFGAFVSLYFFVQDGTRGPNRFGPDPKNPNQADVFA